MKRIAVVTSTVGYHWVELAAAYEVFTQAQAQVDFFSVSGAVPVADPVSLQVRKHFSKLGFGVTPALAPDTSFGQNLKRRLESSKALLHLMPKDYGALYLPGGHGCLFDVNTNPVLHSRILDFYQNQKILAGVCHATSTFAFTEERGLPITQGKKLTGFPDLLDDLLVAAKKVDPRFLPIPFSNDGKLAASRAKNDFWMKAQACLNPNFNVVDLPFVTGVGPLAAAPVAKHVLRLMKHT